MANAVRSKSGPGALCVGPRRSLCQGPTLSVGQAKRSLSGRSLCWDPALLCVGARCRALALCLSGPGAFCVRAVLCLSVSGCGDLCQSAGAGCLCALCRGPALSVSGAGALCTCRTLTGPRYSLAVCVGNSYRAPACQSFGPVLLPPVRFRVPPIRCLGVPGMSAGHRPSCHPQTMLRSRHREHVQPLAGNADADTGQFHQGTSSPTVSVRVYLRLLSSSWDEASVPFAFSGHKTMPSRMIRGLDNPLTRRRSHASKAHPPLSWDLQYSRNVTLSSELYSTTHHG